MARKATGGLIVDERRKDNPVFWARFTANGQRRHERLGSLTEGMTYPKAQQALRHLMADVERGWWQPPSPEVVEAPREMRTFHEFASEWFERQVLKGGRRGTGLSAKGREDLEWRLSNHLLKTFASKQLDAITVPEVDRFCTAKVREGKLSPTSINKCLATLSAILEQAVEYELIERNPAAGKRRRLPSQKPQRSWLDRADHIAALLDGAGKLDEEARTRRGQRRALLATLVFAGLRIGEALALRWQDVDLARGTIKVRAAKTDAGIRVVNMLPALRDELVGYRARLVDPAPGSLVFRTTTGKPLGATNVRRRVLAKAVEHADKQLAKEGSERLPERLTPHGLRRTFASLLFAVGEAPPYVMAQMGHTTPNLTLAIYARQMDRRDGEPERLKALVEGADLDSGAVNRYPIGSKPRLEPADLSDTADRSYENWL